MLPTASRLGARTFSVNDGVMDLGAAIDLDSHVQAGRYGKKINALSLFHQIQPSEKVGNFNP